MRFRLPDDCAGVSHAGLALERAPDGTIEAEEGAMSALAAHGIVPLETAEAAVKTARRSRDDDRRLLR